MERKQLSFIARHAPYGSSRASACLDMVLAAAVFDQPVNYIFMDDGIYQLQKDQQPTAIHNKNLGAALPAMELYGIEKIFVDTASLLVRGVDTETLLPLPIEFCSADRIRTLIAQSDHVFVF